MEHWELEPWKNRVMSMMDPDRTDDGQRRPLRG